jgi:CRP-like cAMP-binding protein
MNTFLDHTADFPTRVIPAGEYVLRQDDPCGALHILIEGEVEVLRDEVRVAKVGERGAVFGEMSMLLGGPCTASVRALGACRFASIDEPRTFLASTPAASLQIAELLARRIDALNRYLIDVKQQYEGHDHLGMVDDVLGSLMHRQPRRRPPGA